jgi:hypothetical protein
MTNNEEITAHSSRSRALKRLILLIAELLGPNGAIAAGAIVLVVFLGWAVYRIVKRPQRMVWGPCMA